MKVFYGNFHLPMAAMESFLNISQSVYVCVVSLNDNTHYVSHQQPDFRHLA